MENNSDIRGKRLILGAIALADYAVAVYFFWKLRSPNSIFSINHTVLFILAGVWVALGLITRKLYFDRFRKTLYGLISIAYVDFFCYLAVYFFFTIKGIGGEGPDLRFWAGFLGICFSEFVLFIIFTRLVVLNLPLYYEPPVGPEIGRDDSIDLGAKFYDSLSVKEDSTSLQTDVIERIFDIHNQISEMNCADACKWISSHAGTFGDDSLVLESNDKNYLSVVPHDRYRLVICNDRINNARQLNQFLEEVNTRMVKGGCLSIHAVTSKTRRDQILKSCPVGLNYIIQGFDYFFTRVCPKIDLTRGLYLTVTRGQNRNIPRVEILGRLCRAGFSIVDEEMRQGEFYVTLMKTKEPSFSTVKPNYGPLIKLSRVGKDGEIIRVYKMRSMYAYSEYLQEYAYNCLGLEDGGKLKNDFRVTPYGRFIRKCWIDELPMILNLLKGEMKLFGVRPLSKQYFSLYTPEMQALRIKVKPGLIPPFYSDDKRPVTIEDVQDNERRYIEAYIEAPLKTDLRYMGKALVNILFKRARSH